MDIALYRLVDEGRRGCGLKEAVESIRAIDDCRDRVISYLNTEFVCVTFKPKGAEQCGCHGKDKAQNLRAHYVRVGRYFNLLDFCRNGRAVENGIDLVPKKAESSGRDYRPIPEETAARSFAAALDPLVEQLGRISVVRGMETAGFAHDGHAELHRWDRDGPWRLVVNGGGIMLHARRPGGPVAAAQKCATDSPLSVETRGGGCTAWSSMQRYGLRLSMRG